MKKFQEVMQRPIHNVKNVDYGASIFISLSFILLITFIIPPSLYSQVYSSLKHSLLFLFSFEWIEPIKTESSQDSIGKSIYDSTRITEINKANIFLNYLKVGFLITLALLILGFLFKKPKNN